MWKPPSLHTLLYGSMRNLGEPSWARATRPAPPVLMGPLGWLPMGTDSSVLDSKMAHHQ